MIFVKIPQNFIETPLKFGLFHRFQSRVYGMCGIMECTSYRNKIAHMRTIYSVIVYSAHSYASQPIGLQRNLNFGPFCQYV